MYNRAYLWYLPDYMGRIREIRSLAGAIDPLLQQAEAENDGIVREGLISTATGEGLRRWEELFGTGGGSIEERRSRLLSYIAGCMPFTVKTLCGVLEAICGEGMAKAAYAAQPYTIEVWIKPSVMRYRMAVETVLKRMLPANMVFEIKADVSTHKALSVKTHRQLSIYRHTDI